jgi:hypothetical protein
VFVLVLVVILFVVVVLLSVFVTDLVGFRMPVFLGPLLRQLYAVLYLPLSLALIRYICYWYNETLVIKFHFN